MPEPAAPRDVVGSPDRRQHDDRRVLRSRGSRLIRRASVKPSTSGIWQSEMTTSNGSPAPARLPQRGQARTGASLTAAGFMRQLASISSRMRRLVALSSTTSTRSPSSALGWRRDRRRGRLRAADRRPAVKWNVLPRPTSLSTQSCPPISSTSRCAIARPEAGAAVPARRRAVGLREGLEDLLAASRAGCRCRCR